MSDDQPKRNDHYPRTNAQTSLVVSAASVLRAVGAEEQYSDEWWSARDAQIAAERIAEAQAMRDSELRMRAAMLKADGGFPAIAVDCAMTKWDVEVPAFAHARSFVEARSSALVLAGGTGAGKSSAAALVALLRGGNSPAFIRAAELEGRGRYDHDLSAWLRSRSMLAVDDLGVEHLDGKGAFRSLLDMLIDMYCGDRKRVVITTNLLAEKLNPLDRNEEPQFSERYGARIVSRLYEVGVWGDCGSKDLRREARP